MRYGMPYMGSKNRIAKWIIDNLPPATHFYDLFGGGGAISHCALLSGKYKYVHYNELNTLIVKAFTMAVNGEFKNEKRWISREDFNRLKDTDPYVSLCFSFGTNSNKGYCYSREIEPFKKAVHYAICFNDFSLLKDLNIHIDENLKGRLNICKAVNTVILQHLINLNRLQRLEHLESLDRLQGLEPLKYIQITNLDYRDVKIESDSVIYCDIPYKNTEQYSIGDFNHNEFYEWARRQNNIYISEYNMPEYFKIVSERNIKSILSATSNDKTVTEKLFKVD
jgi:site-specific DNA-adenine methylase